MCANVTRSGREGLLKKVCQFDARRIFLALDTYTFDPEKKQKMLSALREHCAFFKSHGFEVGAWFWSFMTTEEHPYASITSVSESIVTHKNFVCPSDPDFVKFASRYIADIASCGVDILMFDDDFRFGSLPNGTIGCLCENHRKAICEKVGEELSADELARAILSGGRNKYRDAWIKTNGEALEGFARAVRAAVDRVNPSLRLGACACLSSWDTDGTSPTKISHILAGNTKPFVRLIGAPYWAAKQSWGSHLQDVVELHRMESVWTQDGEIEIFAEGDAFPRPRTACPASYLEGFDTAIRASGCTDGILKYGIDYVSSADYENGYARLHIKNRPLYEKIDEFFSGKTACGVRVYESPQKAADMEIGDIRKAPSYFNYSLLSTAARSMTACSLPTTYEGNGVCGAVFGQSARYLTADNRKKGLIIDAEAARILTNMGVDVGIRELGEAMPSSVEFFPDYNEYVMMGDLPVFMHTFDEKIRVISQTDDADGVIQTEMKSAKGSIPTSYLYENADGERYLVLNFDTRFRNKDVNTVGMRHYARSRSYADSIEWLSRGDKLPAYIYGNPNLYVMAKKDGDTMTVGLWNFFADEVLDGEIFLDGEYSSIRFLNCDGELCGNKVKLSTAIAAFGFCAFEVKK